jgi:hypothetical protein
MKRLIALIPSMILILSGSPSYAGSTEPKPVSCWFFRGEKLELQQTCIYQSFSGAGVWAAFLQWEDGVKTRISRGIASKDDKRCKDDGYSLDRVCGLSYYRHPQTLNRISDEDSKRMRMNNQEAIFCVQVGRNSVCY